MTKDKWQVVEQSGYEGEVVVGEYFSLREADLAVKSLYFPDEIETLHVQFLKNTTTEY